VSEAAYEQRVWTSLGRARTSSSRSPPQTHWQLAGQTSFNPDRQLAPIDDTLPQPSPTSGPGTTVARTTTCLVASSVPLSQRVSGLSLQVTVAPTAGLWALR
jgi:hypothetical protein